MNDDDLRTTLKKAKHTISDGTVAQLTVASRNGPTNFEHRIVPVAKEAREQFRQGIVGSYWTDKKMNEVSFRAFEPGRTYRADEIAVVTLSDYPRVQRFVDETKTTDPANPFDGDKDDFRQQLKAYVVHISSGDDEALFISQFSLARNLHDNQMNMGFHDGQLDVLKQDPHSFTPGFQGMVVGEQLFLSGSGSLMMGLFRDVMRQDLAARTHVAYNTMDRVGMRFEDDDNMERFQKQVDRDPRLSGRLLALEEEGVLAQVTMEKLVAQNQKAAKHRIDILDESSSNPRVRFQSRHVWKLIIQLGGGIVDNAITYQPMAVHDPDLA